jgi:FtsZ-binding cell division protein ZapB
MQSTEIQNAKMDVEPGAPDTVTKTNAKTAETLVKIFKLNESRVRQAVEHSNKLTTQLNALDTQCKALQVENQVLKQRTAELYETAQRQQYANQTVGRALKHIMAKMDEMKTMLLMHDQVVGPQVNEFMSNREVCEALAEVLGIED